MIQIKTSKANRFNQTILIGKDKISVDKSGLAEVEETSVSKALLIGFELVDKDQKFSSETELQHIEDVNDLLEAAKKQAAEIIKQAEDKAKVIIADAESKAKAIIADNNVDELTEYKESLQKLTVAELKDTLVQAGVAKEKYASIVKKDDLINFIIKEVAAV